MTQSQQGYVNQQMATRREPSAWAGLAVFAGLMMIMLGSFTAITGLVAIFDDGWLVVTDTALVTFDLTTWGWVWLIMGILVVVAGVGLLSGQMWARVVGVILASLNALGQLIYMPIYPVWSIVLIALDVLVIYALTAHGGEMRNRR